jgi:hypothetical protein
MGCSNSKAYTYSDARIRHGEGTQIAKRREVILQRGGIKLALGTQIGGRDEKITIVLIHKIRLADEL